MKKLYLFAIFLSAFVFFSSAKTAFALSCSVSVNPSSGTQSTNYTASGTCDSDSVVVVQLTQGSNVVQADSVNTSGNQYSTSFSSLPSTGSYTIMVFDGFGNLLGQSNINVATGGSSIPACCAVSQDDPDFCTKAAACGSVPANATNCPGSCGPNAVSLASCGDASKWVCPQSTSTSTTGCGALGQNCCQQAVYWSRCNAFDNLSCDEAAGNKCVTCGVDGAPCCVNYACGSGLICVEGVTGAGKFGKCQTLDSSCKYPVQVQSVCPAGQGERCLDGGGNAINICCPTGKCPNLPSTQPGGETRCDAGKGIRTAIGCLTVSGSKGVASILSWATGIAGGIAFVMILYAAFQITTAQGDPKRVKASQELITAALAGLFLVAFAVVVLNIIGVNVLGLQGFGFKG